MRYERRDAFLIFLFLVFIHDALGNPDLLTARVIAWGAFSYILIKAGDHGGRY